MALGDGLTVKWIWGAKWEQLMEVLKGFEWYVEITSFYEHLEAMMLVANVSKHGVGPSLDRLKERLPSFLGDVGLGTPQHHHDYLPIEDADIERFSAAAIQFLESVPDKHGTIGATASVPDSFRKAYQADMDARKKPSRSRR